MFALGALCVVAGMSSVVTIFPESWGAKPGMQTMGAPLAARPSPALMVDEHSMTGLQTTALFLEDMAMAQAPCQNGMIYSNCCTFLAHTALKTSRSHASPKRFRSNAQD